MALDVIIKASRPFEEILIRITVKKKADIEYLVLTLMKMSL